MFVGGSVGSTGGAVEIARWPVIGTSLRRERFTAVHPAAASPWGWAGAPEERAIRDTDPYWLLTHVYCRSKKIIALLKEIVGRRAGAGKRSGQG